jgi:DNA polymerase-3 subunit gamma/tau
VSKDESTLRLLEAAPSIKQRYLQQTLLCPVDFLYKALDLGSNCDISYKNSKNPRLHIELCLIKLCFIMTESRDATEKKKSDEIELTKSEKEHPVPSKPEISRQENEFVRKSAGRQDPSSGKHVPVFEKPAKSFSIKDIITEAGEPEVNHPSNSKEPVTGSVVTPMQGIRENLSAENFTPAWQEFIDKLKSDGTRITSMFKSITPELEDEHTLTIHLSNAAQKDLFLLNYKQRLINFLENKFILSDLDIVTAVDQSETNDIIYSDEQKYNYLQAKYPVLKDFKKTFNLDIN